MGKLVIFLTVWLAVSVAVATWTGGRLRRARYHAALRLRRERTAARRLRQQRGWRVDLRRRGGVM